MSHLARRLWTEFALLFGDFHRIPSTLIRTRKTGIKPYVLPGVPYRLTSAGARACHRLIHELNEAGYDAFSTSAVNPEWNERRLGIVGSYLLVKLGQAIVVYPEVIPGNPLGARHVVRWVLNFPGHLGGDREFRKSELVYAWSEEFYSTDRLLSLDFIEHDLFNDRNLPLKDIDCSYLGKGLLRGVKPIPMTEGMTQITKKWPSKRADLAGLLRRTRVLYTYDDQTMLVLEALLCGCRVIFLPEHREIQPDGFKFFRQEHKARLLRFISESQSNWSF